jgi:hypothetical protein
VIAHRGYWLGTEEISHALRSPRRKCGHAPLSSEGLISKVLPFSRLWYGEPDAVSHAIDYAKFFNRSLMP